MSQAFIDLNSNGSRNGLDFRSFRILQIPKAVLPRIDILGLGRTFDRFRFHDPWRGIFLLSKRSRSYLAASFVLLNNGEDNEQNTGRGSLE